MRTVGEHMRSRRSRSKRSKGREWTGVVWTGVAWTHLFALVFLCSLLKPWAEGKRSQGVKPGTSPGAWVVW
jgi:hypothetical protein